MAFARQSGFQIFDDTPRAQFLSGHSNGVSFLDKLKLIIASSAAPGTSLDTIAESVTRALYVGENSFWGAASKEFAASVSGDVLVFANNPNASRILGSIELPTLLATGKASSINGIALSALQAELAQGGLTAVLADVSGKTALSIGSGSDVFFRELPGGKFETSFSREFYVRNGDYGDSALNWLRTV